MLTRWWLRLFGVTCMVIGLVHAVVGPASVIGGGPVNATIDGEMRFYAVLFIGFGAGFVWAAADLPQRVALAYALGGLFFVGGLARLLAIWQTGVPDVFFLVMIAAEVVVPVVNWQLLKRIR